jgi:CDP-paratose 2-epimerase
MKILITGICGFAGASIARRLLLESGGSCEILGIDNLMRAGSHLNRADLLKLGVRVWHGDIRQASDLDALPGADWLIDGLTSSRQLIEHNLGGTLNLLEYCKRHRAGFILLSTSRVYSIPALAGLPVEVFEQAFRLKAGVPLPDGVSERGVCEEFSTAPPLSLYGASKLCSEALALEYGATFDFPVWLNRCGVMAGAGQFGRADQGIFSFWIHAWRARRPLKYIGFNGCGMQVRDALHPNDLVTLLRQQMATPEKTTDRLMNLGGGASNAFSLAQLSAWCQERFGSHEVASDPNPRRFDVPWLVMDSTRAEQTWGWRPQISLEEILNEIAAHAEANPEWLTISDQ